MYICTVFTGRLGMHEQVVPSEKFVDESTRSVCSSLKSLSKQLLLLNASYGKREFRSSGPTITKALRQVLTSVQWMQDTLTEAALAMNKEIAADPIGPGPESVVVSAKEYTLLNAVFAAYTERVASTSAEFSLFSSDDISTTLHVAQCQSARDAKSSNN